MRILVVSNLYPPHFIGGYELGCRDVVEALRLKGHSVDVLTSTYGVGRRMEADGVYRWMETEWSWPPSGARGRQFRLLRKEVRNQEAFRRLLAELEPDIVYIWNPAMTSLSPARIAEERGIPVAYLVSDGWLARVLHYSDEWERLLTGPSSTLPGKVFRWGARRTRLVGSLPRLPLSGVQFVSDFLRLEACATGDGLIEPAVVPWGVDTERFLYRSEPIDSPQRLLYVGQIVSHKGVHTCIEALQLLRGDSRYRDVSLTVAGRYTDDAYMGRLRTLLREHALEDAVHFIGQVDRAELPGLYREADLLLFASVWQEPFSITLLEAMSSGLPVVATATGGSAEILEDGINSLVFEAGNAADCAKQLDRGLSDPLLLQAIRRQARQTVEARYRFADMVDTIEERLAAACRVPASRHVEAAEASR